MIDEMTTLQIWCAGLLVAASSGLVVWLGDLIVIWRVFG